MTLTASFVTGEDRRLPLPTGLLIGGRVVEGRAAPIPVTNPATGRGLHRGVGCERRGHRRRRPQRPRHVPQRDVAHHAHSRPRTVDQPVRRRHRGADGRALRTRDHEQRPADHRDQGADHAAVRVVPLQRRAAARRPDLGGAAARRLPRLHQPVPARRGRHPVVVQPPHDDRLEEPRARPGDRKHRGAQAF